MWQPRVAYGIRILGGSFGAHFSVSVRAFAEVDEFILCGVLLLIL